MKGSFLLTLVALSVFGTLAHAQERRAPAKPKPAAEPAGTLPTPPYQDGQVISVTICKGQPIPDGYVTAGETADNTCPNGAWLLKRKGTRSHTSTPAPTTAAESSRRRAPYDDEESEETADEVLVRRAAEINGEARRNDATDNVPVRVGMTKEEVLLAWGKPYRVERSTDSHSGRSEVWRYRSSTARAWVYFKDAYVSSFRLDH